MPRPALISAADLADAVVGVVVEHGLDAVSMRTVARQAGVSVGAVQHHFASKDELLLAAYRRAIDQVSTRARRHAERTTNPAVYIRALLHELLPLDKRRDAELRVAVAFTARSVHNPRLAELYTHGYRRLVDAVADALHEAIARGQAAPGIDARRAATQVVALVDGLAWHALCAPSELTTVNAVAALDAHLAHLLSR
jgi:TetR/AcrR family transcriptional repressor of bet genes